MTVEEVMQAINQINFVGALPGGQEIDFRASNYIESYSNTPFTNVGGFNFTREFGGYFNASRLSETVGNLEIFFKEFSVISYNVTFQYVFITTFGELERMYPDYFSVDLSQNDWIVVIALGSSGLDIEDVFEGAFFDVTDYLAVTADPSDDFLRSGIYYDVDFDDLFSLAGSYRFNSSFSSKGDVIDFDFSTQAPPTILGNYSLKLNR